MNIEKSKQAKIAIDTIIAYIDSLETQVDTLKMVNLIHRQTISELKQKEKGE